MTRLAEPLDALHADCLEARTDIRRQTTRIRTRIHAWQPQPFPMDTDTRPNRSTK